MPSTSVSELSADELLHLAIADSRNGRHDEAIVKLKRYLDRDPARGAAYHLLAAEHAEIGMFADAIRELERAVALEPESVAARFQLGLLCSLNNDLPRARREWAVVTHLDPHGPWTAFSIALMSLAVNENADALRQLDRGLAMDIPNAALRKDMTRLRDRLESMRGAKAGRDGGAEQQPNNLLLKTYGNSSNGGG